MSRARGIPSTRTTSSQLELTAFLAAIALFCSTLEYLIPKPLPFIRLGLANLPLMLSFPFLSWGNYLWLLLLKIIGQGFINGTLFSYIFVLSIASTASSGLLMRVLWQIGGRQKEDSGITGSASVSGGESHDVKVGVAPAFSYIGISVAGALISNCSQILTAQMLFFGKAIWIIAAPMLAIGLVTSALLGWVANVYANSSKWYESLTQGKDGPSRYQRVLNRQEGWKPDGRSIPVVIGLALLPALFFQRSLWFLAADMLLAVLLAVSVGRKFKLLPNLLVICSMMLVHILQPSGRVLWSIGGFMLTEGSIQEGLRKAFILIGMVYVSQYMTNGRPDLPGKLGKLLSVQLAYFGEFSQLWRREKDLQEKRGVITRIDGLMERVGNNRSGENRQESHIGRKEYRIWLITGIAMLLAMYGLLIIAYLL